MSERGWLQGALVKGTSRAFSVFAITMWILEMATFSSCSAVIRSCEIEFSNVTRKRVITLAIHVIIAGVELC